MTSQIIAASAFWLNDKPNGIGVTLVRADMSPAAFDTFVQEVEKLGENLHQHSDMTVDEATEQLHQFVSMLKTAKTYEDEIAMLVLVFGNIKFLTLKGAIDPSDEYNGLLYAQQL
jgi:hypothetical protein